MAGFANFDLLLERDGDRFRARVLDSLGGQAAPVAFEAPLSEIELENLVLRLKASTATVLATEGPKLDAVHDVGARLFDSVFRDDVLRCLRTSTEVANAQGVGLRLRLRIVDAPTLSRLPWEMLFDRSNQLFVCLSSQTPLVRYLELPHAVHRQAVDGPLRMLAVLSSPVDFPPLDVEREWAKLVEAVEPLRRSGLVVLDRLPRPSLEALEEAAEEPYHVLHFVGHGGFDTVSGNGLLAFTDHHGRSSMESGIDIGQHLHQVRTLRLVVLNSCEGGRVGVADPLGGVAASLVVQGVPAVIAMQFEITDEAAIRFSRTFYGALARGQPVDAASSSARRALHAVHKAEWATPVLYLRAPDGELFDIPPRPSPAPAPAPAPTPHPAPAPAPADLDTLMVVPPPPRPESAALALAPLYSCSMLAPLPFAVWAIKTRRRDLWIRFAAYAAALIATLAATSIQPLESAVGGMALALVAVASVDAWLTRARLTDVESRTWGRDVAEQMPEAARKLHIGRPDLLRTISDGGLVDLNSAPTRVLQTALSLPEADAKRLAHARDERGRFADLDELLGSVPLDKSAVDRLRDVAVFL